MATRKKKTPGKRKAKKKAPAKKPTKKKPARKKRPPTKAMVPAQPQEELDNVDLRRLAGERYIYSASQPSISELAEHPFFKGRITIRTLERWAVEDRWAENRKRWGEQYTTKVQQRLGTELIRARVNELKVATEIQNAIDAKLLKKKKGKLVIEGEFRSPESALNTRLKNAQHIDQLRGELAGQIMPQAASAIETTDRQSKLHPNLKPRLSEEEMFQASNVVLRMRMRSQQADLEAERVERGEPKPPLQVVDGEKE